jgi:hypothetical protein
VRRFLLVGCGGSGGATLQFVMDQLRADLARLGIHQLPRGWQFVHLDVPATPPRDASGYPLPPSVPDQGGQYVGLTTTGATYPNVARPVEQRLAERHRLNALVRWRPSPDDVNVAIAEGAGQYRAVGRMLTLNQAVRVRDALADAFGTLQGEAVDELRSLAARVSEATAEDVERAPVVIVVTSMAGGAGASMALDVCRMLSTVANVNPESVALFLYTAEVFRSLAEHLRLGAEANAAAMMGELIASQSGAAGLDAEVLAAVGVSGATGSAPFGRVIPIGARIGSDGAQFGDGSRGGIYRGIGRGLASLMMSGTATQGFITVAVENPQVPPFSQAHLGWGVDCSRLAWGAFGYASVDLGRDRYAEFAAQRLARVAVDRLVDGRRRPGDGRSAAEWARDVVSQVLWDRICAALRLPRSSEHETVERWLVQMRRRDVESAAAEIFDKLLAPVYSSVSQVDAAHLAEGLPVATAAKRRAVEEAIDGRVVWWAFDWFLHLRDALLAEVTEIVADYGLGPAAALLRRLEDRTTEYTALLRELGRDWRPPNVVAPDPDGLRVLASIRGLIDANHGALTALHRAHRVSIQEALGAGLADRMSLVLAEMAEGLIVPLRRAVGEAVAVLVRVRESRAEVTGQALLRTDSYAAWPGGLGEAPERFVHAHNEVLLTASTSFEPLFQSHVVLDGKTQRELRADLERVDPSVPRIRTDQLSFEDALADVVTALLRDDPARTEADPDRRLFQVGTGWWPSVFREDPRAERGARQVPAQRGQVKTVLAAAHVLELCRAYVARADAFHDFIGQSMADYLSDEDVGAPERQRRADELRAAFGKALNLARPLVAVNAQTVAHMYPRQSVQNYYSFSALPLPAALAAAIEADLSGPDILPATLTQFRTAVDLGHSSNATRIDVFGSHEPFSPVVFRSLLEPVARRWAQLPNESRPSFWTWRRSRRLSGAIPASDVHRGAMVAGWYVARLTGMLRHPGEHHMSAAAIYDERSGWVSFPEPLLTLRRFWHGDALDCLPAVLETMSIALAECYDSPDLRPLHPYRLLREMYDDTDGAPSVQEGPAARRRLSAWIQTGKSAGGDVPSERYAGPADGTARQRHAAMLKGLTQSRSDIGFRYLAPGERGALGGGTYSEPHVDGIDRIPLFHEIAADCYQALGRLVHIIESVDPDGTDQPGQAPIS